MLTTVVIIALVLLSVNVPIFLIFLVAAIIGFLAFTTIPLTVVLQNLFGGLDKFVLIAVPFFIFGAEVMGRGGMAKRLIDWAASIVCWLPGNVPLAVLTSATLFGALSGSSPATVSAIGRITYPALTEEGYSEKFALGLIASSGSIALLIPPSIMMILYAMVTNTSVGALFMGGIIPGLLMALCFMIYTTWYSVKGGIGKVRGFNVGYFLKTTKDAGWTLGVPVLIIGGIYSGIFSPTEAAVVSTFYAILVSVFIYKEINLKDVIDIAKDSAMLTGKIFIIVASSAVFAWLITVGQAGPMILEMVDALNPSPFATFVIINVIFLIAGMFIDPNSATLILVPLLFPLSMASGVDPVHFGIIITFNLAVGMYTPPFGMNIFIASSIFKKNMTTVVSGLMPFIYWSLVALILVTYIPWLSLAIPNALYK